MIEMWGGRRVFWIRSTDLSEDIALATRLGADTVGISTRRGFVERSLDVLERCAFASGVVIPFASDHDLTALQTRHDLEYLFLSGGTDGFALSGFEALQELHLEWDAGINLSKLVGLRALVLFDYKPSSADLTGIAHLAHLQSVTLQRTTIASLSGAASLQALRELKVILAPRLRSLSAIFPSDVERLELESCRKIVDVESVDLMRNLRVLRMLDCGPLSSLRFLRRCPKLKEFRFVRTDVADGDMTPLFGLEQVGFLPNRRFSHSPEEVAAEIARRATSQ